MIIPDEESKGSARSPHLSVDLSLTNDATHAEGSCFLPIPPEPSSREDEGLPPYTPRETDPLLLHAQRSGNSKHGRRTIRVVMGALFASIVVGSFLAPIGFRLLSPRRHEITAVCHRANTWTALNETHNDNFHHVDTGLGLPFGLNSLQFISGCRDCITKFSIQPSLDDRDMNIQIHLRAKHRNLTQLHQMKLCSTVLPNNTISTSLQAPEIPFASTELYFLEVLFTFPRNEAVGGITSMTEFNVGILSSADVTVGDLTSQVRFGTFVVVIEDGNMSFHGVRTDRAVIATGRGSIDAQFHAGEYVKISALDSFVKLNATMSRTTDNTPQIQVRGSGPAQVNISLEDTSGIDSRPLELAACVYSSTDQVELNILDAPMQSLVHAVAHAERGSATVNLSPSFEGKLVMIHGLSAGISIDEDMADPRSQGRRRQLTQERINNHHVVGRTWWEAGDGTQCKGPCPGNTLNGSQVSEEEMASAAYVVAQHGTSILIL